jgi:hypothetical protein
MKSGKVDGKVITPAVSITAIIDTGTTYLVVDKTSYVNLLNIAKTKGITTNTTGYFTSLHGCKKSDCSDFPSIEMVFKKSADSDELIPLTLESKYYVK